MFVTLYCTVVNNSVLVQLAFIVRARGGKNKRQFAINADLLHSVFMFRHIYAYDSLFPTSVVSHECNFVVATLERKKRSP